MAGELSSPTAGAQRLVDLLVPELADFAVVYALGNDDARGARSAVEIIALGHEDPAVAEAALSSMRRRALPTDASWGVPMALRTGKVACSNDVTDAMLREFAESDADLAEMRASGVVAHLALPLMARGRVIGALGLSHAAPGRRFEEEDVAIAKEVAARAALLLDQALLFRRVEAAERRASFLAAASSALAESLDYGVTLRKVAQLAVPTIADWCTVTVIQEDGAFRRVAVVHSDPAKADLARAYEQGFPPESHRNDSLGAVARAQRPILLNDLDETALRAAAQDEEHLRILRALGVSSCIMVPLVSRARQLGVISFMLGDESRRFRNEDLSLAEDLSARAALAIENALLFQAERRSEEGLRAMIDSLAEAVAARDTFLSVASHELKTPVTSLMLRLDSLARALTRTETMPHERMRDHVEAARTQLGRLDALISALLDVSRIASGRLHLEIGDTDAAAVLRDVVSRLEAHAARAGSTITVDAPTSLPMRSDAMRLEQIAVNLLENAVKYGAGKPIELHLAASDASVTLRVVDHGIGIAEADQARVFERFERAVSARNYGGLGLGLFIVRTLCEALGGSIAVESAPGVETTFRVVLPLSSREPR